MRDTSAFRGDSTKVSHGWLAETRSPIFTPLKGVEFRFRCVGELGSDFRRGVFRGRTLHDDEEERDGIALGFGSGICEGVDKEAAIEMDGKRMIELAFGSGLESIWCSPMFHFAGRREKVVVPPA